VFCGLVENGGKKKKKIAVAFEPPQPLQKGLYYCGKGFQLEKLKRLYQSTDGQQLGVVIISGSETLIAKLNNTSQSFEVTSRFSVKLPNNHTCGGWSQQRFSRQRDEAIHNYMRKVAEHCKKDLVSPRGEDGVPDLNVRGVIFAGPGELKHELVDRSSSLLEGCIRSNIVGIVNTSQGGKPGIAELLTKSDFLQLQINKNKEEEDTIVKDFLRSYEEKDDVERYGFGVNECKFAMKNGLLSKVLIHEDVEDGLFKKIVQAKIMNHGMPKGISAEQVILVKSSSERGRSIIEQFQGVVALLFYPVNLQDLISRDGTSVGNVETLESGVKEQEVEEEEIEEVSDENSRTTESGSSSGSDYEDYIVLPRKENDDLSEERKMVMKFLSEQKEQHFYAYGILECKMAMKNGLLKKLLVNNSIHDSLLQKIVAAKKQDRKMPDEANGVEEVVVITEKGVLADYEGAVGLLHFEVNMKEIMEDASSEEVMNLQQPPIADVEVHTVPDKIVLLPPKNSTVDRITPVTIRYTPKVFIPGGGSF